MTLKNSREPFLCYFKLCDSFRKHSLETHNLGQIGQFLEPCDLEMWLMTLKNNRAPLLGYFKFYASFRIHLCIQTGVTVRIRPILVKIDDFFSHVTLQFDVWPWKTIGRLFYYAASSFVHHFITIGEFKLEWQCWNAQFRPKIKDFLFLAVWPCNLTYELEKPIGHLFYVIWPCNLMYNLERQYGTSSMLLQDLCIIPKP